MQNSKIFKVNNENIKFKALQAFYWSGFSFYQMFFVYYLTVDRGYQNASVGFILSIGAFITLIGQTMWGVVADKLQNIKIVAIILFASSTILISTYPLYPTLLTVGIVTCLIMFFDPSIPPILDSWTSQYVEEKKTTNYGAIRLWGSASFAVVATIVGRVSLLTGVGRIFHFHAIFAVLAIITSLLIKYSATHKAKAKVLRNLRDLVKNRNYVFFIFCATIVFASFRMSLTFLPSLIVQTGGDQSDLSIAWVIAAISEVIVFSFADKVIKRFKPLKTCLFAFGVFTLRIVIFYYATSHIWILSSQMLQGLSFGLFLPASITFINAISKTDVKTSALTLAAAIYTSVSGIISSYIGGLIIDQYGLGRMYVVGIAANLITIAAFVLYFIIIAPKHDELITPGSAYKTDFPK